MRGRAGADHDERGVVERRLGQRVGGDSRCVVKRVVKQRLERVLPHRAPVRAKVREAGAAELAEHNDVLDCGALARNAARGVEARALDKHDAHRGVLRGSRRIERIRKEE